MRKQDKNLVDKAIDAVDTAATLAIGGAGLATEKVLDTARDLAHRGAEAAEEGRERAGDAAETVRSAARDARRTVKETIDPPDTRPYEERTLEELNALATERNIEGRSTMNKAKLIASLRAQR